MQLTNAQMAMPSVMKHDFSRAPQADIQRSRFKRCHGYKTTMDAGYLIPFYVDEALPGDTFNVKLSSVLRIQTLLYPIMDNMTMDVFFFAVPNRLLWTNWQRFMGERDPDPDSSIDYTLPVMDTPVGGFVQETLADYFGLPIGVHPLEVSTLPFRAYNLIYNQWFRDQNLQDSVQVDLDDGPDAITDYVLLRRGKRHDYFTSGLPWPQKGDEIDLPLGETAPVEYIAGAGLPALFRKSSDDSLHTGVDVYAKNTTAALAQNVTGDDSFIDPNGTLQADLSSATSASINSLRQAFQLQRMLERDARGGTRYTEIIQSHFRVVSPDARLQRPEYLGGGSRRVNVDPVPSTSQYVGEDSYVGDLGGLGYVNQSGIGFTKSFTEHCTLLGIINIRADLTYQKGIERMWSRQTRYDYYWPSLAHLGEQAVLNKEIYAQGTSADDEVFAYQERFAEYKYKPSIVTGKFRSDATGTLDPWHLSQDFSSLPTLGPSFIVENPPIDRIIAVTDESQFYFDAYIDAEVTRPMPMYSVPGLIDHF